MPERTKPTELLPARSLVIRPRVDADVAPLCDVLTAQAPSSRYPIRWPWSGPLEEFLVRPGEEAAWTAEIDGRPVGHVAVGAVVDTGDGIATGWTAATGTGVEALACVAVLFVDQATRGRGVASQLLDAAVSWIHERDRIPVLDVVDIHPDVVALYARRGWREVGTAEPAWLPEATLVLMVLDDRSDLETNTTS